MLPKLELDCTYCTLSVCLSSHGEGEGGEIPHSLMTRNILYGGQLVRGVECQKSEGEGGGGNNLKMYGPFPTFINSSSVYSNR